MFIVLYIETGFNLNVNFNLALSFAFGFLTALNVSPISNHTVFTFV